MAFPTSGLVDAFTGAGPTAPPSASWTRLVGLSQDLRLTNNQVDSTSGSALGGCFWNPATFGPDSEAYIDVDTIGSTNHSIRLWARMLNAATEMSGYFLDVEVLGTADSWKLFRVDGGSATQLGATVNVNIANGEKSRDRGHWYHDQGLAFHGWCLGRAAVAHGCDLLGRWRNRACSRGANLQAQ